MSFPIITEENKTIWLLSSEMVVREGNKLLLVWKSGSINHFYIFIHGKRFLYRTLAEGKMDIPNILLHSWKCPPSLHQVSFEKFKLQWNVPSNQTEFINQLTCKTKGEVQPSRYYPQLFWRPSNDLSKYLPETEALGIIKILILAGGVGERGEGWGKKIQGHFF